jgi:tRNA pseudouridine32 synthase/23S rRNA pseudouridine746 synthase/23S rRNA pseudouridine1911/1915/1917 synthase
MARPPRPHGKYQPLGLDILHEDRDIIVVNKAAGLLTMSDGRDNARTAYAALTDYVRKGNPKSPHRIFIVHRLDRDTSGVLVFARSEQAKFFLQDHWPETSKIYLALVEGQPPEESGTITSHLAENAAGRVYSTPNTALGRLSHTRYRVVKRYKSRALLEIDLLTGRKNQIRVHLADLGCPIVGDDKYGNAARSCKRLALHAQSLTLPHPHTGQPLTFTAPVPESFTASIGAPPPEARLPDPKPEAPSANQPRRSVRTRGRH